MDERAERIGRNEALFRDLNERVKDVNAAFGELTDAEFVCECGAGDCLERIRLPLDEYERLRADPKAFIVKHGHDEPAVESVVARCEDYVVVRKHAPEAAALAVETDPRA